MCSLRCDAQSRFVELHALADGVVHHFREREDRRSKRGERREKRRVGIRSTLFHLPSSSLLSVPSVRSCSIPCPCRLAWPPTPDPSPAPLVNPNPMKPLFHLPSSIFCLWNIEPSTVREDRRSKRGERREERRGEIRSTLFPLPPFSPFPPVQFRPPCRLA